MKNEITIVGMGTGPVGELSREASEVLLGSDKIFARFLGHPVVHWLKDQGKRVIGFDSIYTMPGIVYEDVYSFITRAILTECHNRGRVVYALPGSPFIFETTTGLLQKRGAELGFDVRVVLGVSFIELVCAKLSLDPLDGLQILNGNEIEKDGDNPNRSRLSSRTAALIAHFAGPPTNAPDATKTNARAIADVLLAKYPPDHPVTVVWSAGQPTHETKVQSFPLRDVAEAFPTPFLATLYVPPAP